MKWLSLEYYRYVFPRALLEVNVQEMPKFDRQSQL